MQETPESTAIEIRPLAPSDPQARRLIGMLDRLQRSLYPAESNHLDPVETLEREDVTFLAAFVAGRVVGCGAVKRISPSPTSPGYGEIKRMYVAPGARGRGVGSALMDDLESSLLAHGIVIARLETGVRQPEALMLYERRGYVRTSPFGEYGEDPLSVFYEKRLICQSALKFDPLLEWAPGGQFSTPINNGEPELPRPADEHELAHRAVVIGPVSGIRPGRRRNQPDIGVVADHLHGQSGGS